MLKESMKPNIKTRHRITKCCL